MIIRQQQTHWFSIIRMLIIIIHTQIETTHEYN